MTAAPAAIDHRAIEQAAANWLMRRAEPDWSDDHARELDDWLAQSHAHAAAYWRLEAGYAQLDRLAALPPLAPVPSPRARATLPQWSAIAAVVVGLVGGGWALSRMEGPAAAPESLAFSTHRGQISTVHLTDGSVLSLDSGSAIRVAFGDRGRRVWIDRGRVFFDVAHDARRPFRVDAGAGRIVVLGTRFVVTRTVRSVSAAVLRGSVRFSRAAAGETATFVLTRGELGYLSPSSISATRVPLQKVENGLEWRDGMIVFDNTPIENAIASLNAYNRRQLVLVDRKDAALTIGGRFRLNNIEGFARLMKSGYSINIGIHDAIPQNSPSLVDKSLN